VRSSVALLVDASVDTLEMYAVGLGCQGFTTLTATEGLTAIHHARMSQLDAIVTEIQLAGRISGWDLIRRLKTDPVAQRIPVVILTGRIEPSLAARAQQAGCAALLTKPCLPEDLVTTLRHVIPTHAVAMGPREPDADAHPGTSFTTA
jgi:CheY-like chemotaxis protein